MKEALEIPLEPKFKKGDHIQSTKNKSHGIIREEPVKNYWGWVYCFYPKNGTGNMCVPEREATLYKETKPYGV